MPCSIATLKIRMTIIVRPLIADQCEFKEPGFAAKAGDVLQNNLKRTSTIRQSMMYCRCGALDVSSCAYSQQTAGPGYLHSERNVSRMHTELIPTTHLEW